MRVKWNRNLDGVRPLITVPETDVISNGKLDIENNDNKCSFTDLNDNNTVDSDSQSVINVNKSRKCESPSPSSVSISSRRSDKSKVGISSLFSLFKLKDKEIIDNNNEDCVSNYSELSNATINATIPSFTSHKIAKRKSSYECGDAVISGSEKFEFEADTRRRRRANTLLLKSSLRRSWQQLNGQTKLAVNSGYIITKEHSNYSHSPLLSLRRKVSEPELCRSSQNRAINDVLPEVKIEQNSDNIAIDQTNRTGFDANPNRKAVISDPLNDEVCVNTIFDKTDAQIVIKCNTPSNLNQKDCGFDETDNKVQSVTTILNSSDSQKNSLNTETVFDPKNGYKNTDITQHKLSSDKNTNIVCNVVSEVKLQNSEICVTNANDLLDLNSDNTDNTDNTLNIDVIENKPLATDLKSDQILSIRHELSENKDTINRDVVKSNCDQSITDINSLNYAENVTNNQISNCETCDIIKVKVKKNILPEFEIVSFSAQITPSAAEPTNNSNNNNNNNNNDEAVVLTFINDEPMTKEALENNKSHVFVKSTPIQGILRLRSKDSNSEDNSSDSLTKTNGSKISQKKVHFADNCLHSRHSTRGRSRPIKSRHYGSYGVVASINDKKAINRRPTQANSANTSSKRIINNKTNASNISKKDVRSAQLIDDKQQIQKLTELCEYKTKQLKTLCIDQNYMRLAFDSLSVVIQHLIEQYAPFENPKLKQAFKNANKRCEQLKDNLDAKDLELNDMKLIYEEQINQLMKEREKNYSDLNQAKVTHEANVKKLSEMHCWEVKSLEDKHNREMQLCQQNCNQLLNEIQDKNTELNQTKQLKDALQLRVTQMEDNIMNDKDKKFKYLTEKTKQLELEVDSLKSVMDMKNEKIHALERQMIETQEKINELPFAKETIRGLQQQIENLQVTLERKIHQFNQLTREHEDLKTEYDREMREKRRLSMKNEELAYHLSESFNSESGFNNSHFDLNQIRFKSPALMTEETPIKTNRTFAASSASSRKSHSKIMKSMSSSNSSTSTISKRATSAIYCRSSSSNTDNENSFLYNGIADEVFDNVDSGRKCTNSKMFAETPPQCILDSGFEEIQGLNSLPK